MSNIAYVSLEQDLVGALSDAAITIVTADADYPASNLKTQPMADSARGTGAGIKIRFDMGKNYNVRFWGYLNHNISSGNWVIRTYDDAYATPSGESYPVPHRALDTKFYYKSWTPKQYWEHDFTGCVLSEAYLEMGKMVAAHNPTFFSANYSPGFGRGTRYRSIHNITEFGVTWTYIKQGPIQKVRIRFDPAVVGVIKDELESFFTAISGGGYPCVLIPDNSGSTEIYYMRSVRDNMDWEEVYRRAMMTGLSLDFEEESRGKTQVS